MNTNLITLDVREDLQTGRDPFSKIMTAVAALTPGATLRVVAPFEPQPLFRVLAGQGFAHQSRQLAGGDWEVLFSRSAAASAPVAPSPAPVQKVVGGTGNQNESVELDVRGLEPPQPLVAILEALSQLPPGGSLRARTDRRPMHLYSQLEARGFKGESTEEADGTFTTHINGY